MSRPNAALLVTILAVSASTSAAELHPKLSAYVERRVAEFDQVPADRRLVLGELAAYVRERVGAGEPALLTFICTHNSRRSHFAQLWAAVAAERYGVAGVETFSGGTEATAFNPRAVAALRRAGFGIPGPVEEGENPRYAVALAPGRSPQECFSKVYGDPPNPRSGFCAVMTCSQADESCPAVLGAAARVAIPYIDPKVSDDSLLEAETYDERCAQIAREMLLAFSLVGEPAP